MTDRKRPPPLPPREPEVVVVEEDPPPPTERHPVIPPPPRTPTEPFRLLVNKGITLKEIADKCRELEIGLGKVLASQTELLAVQRKMALQTDGLGRTVNVRFDLFHEELALLRATVTGDHAPRLAAVEKASASQRAKQAAAVGGKYAGLAFGGALALRLLGKAVPSLEHGIEAFLVAVGL